MYPYIKSSIKLTISDKYDTFLTLWLQFDRTKIWAYRALLNQQTSTRFLRAGDLIAEWYRMEGVGGKLPIV